MIKDLAPPLSQATHNYGWNEKARAFWYEYYMDLRRRVLDGGPFNHRDLATVVGFNMNGHDGGPIGERAAQISQLIASLIHPSR